MAVRNSVGIVMYDSLNWRIVKQENPQQFILYEMPGKKEKGVFKTFASAREVIGRSPSFQNGVAKAEAYICSKMANGWDGNMGVFTPQMLEKKEGKTKNGETFTYSIHMDKFADKYFVLESIHNLPLSAYSSLKKKQHTFLYQLVDAVSALQKQAFGNATRGRMRAGNVGGSQYIKREKLLQLLKDGYIQIEHGDAQNGRPGSGVTVRWQSGKVQNYIIENAVYTKSVSGSMAGFTWVLDRGGVLKKDVTMENGQVFTAKSVVSVLPGGVFVRKPGETGNGTSIKQTETNLKKLDAVL